MIIAPREVEIRHFHLFCGLGDGAIVRELEAFGLRVTATDLHPRAPQRGLFDTEDPKPIAQPADATDPAFWTDWNLTIDAVITNPPFSLGNVIRSFARGEGLKLALLLRVSMLEPVEDRAEWLRDDPPSDLILLPRVSFDGNGSDTAATFWFVWRNNQPDPDQRPKFHVFSRADLAQLERAA